MTKLAGDQDDLSPVVALMGDEIGEDMPDVERQVAPDIRLRSRNLATRGDPEFEQLEDTPAAPPEGAE